MRGPGLARGGGVALLSENAGATDAIVRPLRQNDRRKWRVRVRKGEEKKGGREMESLWQQQIHSAT